MKSRLFAIIVASVLLCLSFASLAADIPSSVSGTYAGSGATAGWECTVLAYQISSGGATNRVLDVDCQTPTARRSGAQSLLNACPNETNQPPLPAWGVPCGPAPDYCIPPSVPRWSIVSSSPSTAACSLGELQVVIVPFPNPTGGSVQSTFCRTQIIVPTVPYPGCAPTVIAKPRPRK